MQQNFNKTQLAYMVLMDTTRIALHDLPLYVLSIDSV